MRASLYKMQNSRHGLHQLVFILQPLIFNYIVHVELKAQIFKTQFVEF